jgi:uncharacterized membrane protein YhiD involved in acid resistance
MPQSFQEFFRDVVDGPSVDLKTLAVRIGAALIFGWLIALTHRLTQGRRDDFQSGFGAALVMLTVILALITQVIGNDLARAFTLVGALAVVRFRTRVNDTRDTAYVILAVAVGMAVGTNNMLVALLSIPTVGIAAVLLPHVGFARPRLEGSHQLVVRIDRETDLEASFASVCSKHLTSRRCDGTESAQQGACLDITYTVRLSDPAAAPEFIRQLLALPGVKAADLRRRIPR